MTLVLVKCQTLTSGQQVCAPLTDTASIGYVTGFALLMLVGGAFLAWGAWKLYVLRRVRHIEVDPETHHGTLRYKVPIGDSLVYKDPEAPAGERRVRLKNAARIVLDGKTTWITHRRTGWNFVPPPDALTTGSDPMLAYLAIDDPAAYAHAVATNDAQDALRAQVADDKWAKLAPWLLAGVALTLVALVVGVYYLTQIAKSMAAPA
jgi:hypothetical protein